MKRFLFSFILTSLFLLEALFSAQEGISANCTDHISRCQRPIELGVSGINVFDTCSSGTLGSLLDVSGTHLILSNNHVLARENDGKPGQEPIVQPGTLDHGCLKDGNDVVGVLGGFIPIDFSGGSNVFDLAFAPAPDTLVNSGGVILDIGQVNPNPFPGSFPPVGTAVKKSGRTTGLTVGQVSAVDVTVLVSYTKGTARFEHQYMITPGSFSAAGDSGSLIVENTASCPRPIGLLFAGGASSTFANPINLFLQFTGFKIVGNTSCPATVSSLEAGTTEEAMKKAIDIKNRNQDSILAIPGVVGMGIGFSEETKQPVIKIFVEKRSPELNQKLPQNLENLQVEIVETGKITPF